jgi:hypothetical protein
VCPFDHRQVAVDEFQYHFLEYFWPELEFNDTYWFDGTQRAHRNQLFLTPGIVFGRFALGNG